MPFKMQTIEYKPKNSLNQTLVKWKIETYAKLQALAKKHNCSCNEVVRQMVFHCLREGETK